ncbi:MAG: 23S rRNA (adenine(2503)-C(2))-methyltransferase RlmN [Planctomycetota bacterium]|nr:23S rRNA (adenine(2503)-C(2))-methyltransferase RlmN [Planctomycetota bacterium]
MASAEFLTLSPEECAERISTWGGKPFHGRILRRELMQRGVLDPMEMTGLPLALRERLAADAQLLPGRELRRVVARDGTTRLLIALGEGEGPSEPVSDDANALTVEAVHIPAKARDPESGATLCVSTQAGCPVGCPFCASGRLGLARNLSAAEIVGQFVRGRALGPLRRCVVMGIGEPFLNLPALLEALAIVREEMGIGGRKTTVSTVGFPDLLDRALRDKPPFQLAISLHTADDDLRGQLVPAMADISIAEVLSAGDRWFEATGREVTYEIVLLEGVNDSPSQADLLARALGGRRCSVNLIPFNSVSDSEYRYPSPQNVTAFAEYLGQAGLTATVRRPRGQEVGAACGQLRLNR